MVKSGAGTARCRAPITAQAYEGHDGILHLSVSCTLGSASGTTEVTGGTLDLAATTQTQNGGVTLSGGAIQNGTLSSTGSFALATDAASALLDGSGGVIKMGIGTVTLSGADTDTGDTTVNDGTRQLSGSGTLGSASGMTAVMGGTLELGGTTQTQNGGVTLSGSTMQIGTLSSIRNADGRRCASVRLAGSAGVLK